MEDLQLGKKNISATTVVVTSFAVDFLDVISSLVITLLSGSVVMLTQVLEGASDLAASGILLFGLFQSKRKPDKAHPFGYGREIYFAALLAALITFGLTASFSIYFGWERFLHPHKIHDIWLVFIILVVTVFTNGYSFYLSYKRLLRKLHPKHIFRIFYKSSLIETKTTFILDLMGTIASILGIISLAVYEITGDYRLDGIGAMLIGVAIAVCSVFLLAGIKDLLIGRSAAPEVEERIRKAAMSVDEVKDVLGLRTLHIGSEKLLVDLDVHMEAKLTTTELEKLIDKIKSQIRAEVPSVKFLQVELETPRKV